MNLLTMVYYLYIMDNYLIKVMLKIFLYYLIFHLYIILIYYLYLLKKHKSINFIMVYLQMLNDYSQILLFNLYKLLIVYVFNHNIN